MPPYGSISGCFYAVVKKQPVPTVWWFFSSFVLKKRLLIIVQRSVKVNFSCLEKIEIFTPCCSPFAAALTALRDLFSIAGL